MEPRPPKPRYPSEQPTRALPPPPPPPPRPERERDRERERDPFPQRAFPASAPPSGAEGVAWGAPPPPAARRRGRVVGLVGLAVLMLVIAAALGALAYDRSRDDDNGETALAAGTATREAELSLIATAGAVQTAVVRAATPTAAPATPEASPTALTVEVAPTSARTLPTIGPTPARTPARPTATATPATANGPSAAVTDIEALLPNADEVPEGLDRAPDSERTEDQVADAFGDVEQATQNLDDWGWSRNVIRTYQVEAGTLPADATIFLEISIHQFDSRSSARAALDFFADELAAARSLTDQELDSPLGEGARLLVGGPQGENEVTLYVREGTVLIKISGYSEEGSPLADVLATADAVLAKAR